MKKHKISSDVKIVRYVTSWRVSSKLSESFDRLGTITLTQHEIDAIYAHIHKDEVAEKAPCGSCFYFDAIDDGGGDCYRYPSNSTALTVDECQRACGEHRPKE